MGQIAVRKRIGSTTDLSGIVGNNGDIGVDITKSTVVVFDGSTPGGNPLAPANTVWPNATSTTPGYMSASDFNILAALAAIGDATSISYGYMSAADYNTLQALASSNSNSLPNATGNVPNTLVLRDSSGNFAANVITASLIGNVTGNASTVTNGVVTTGSYGDPSWITSLNGSKITGTIGVGVTFLGSTPWTSVTGKPSVVSYFVNDAGYINGSGNTTGTSGGVLSVGGRETASPTPNTVILRSGTGTAQVATPVSSSDIATKAYVDANSGSYGYYPQTVVNLPSNPIAAGGTIAAWSVTVLNESNTGFIKTILLDNVGLTANQSNVFIGFTVDGKPETSYSILEFTSAFRNDYQVAGSYPASVYRMVMDLPYKISIVIRMYTTAMLSSYGTEMALSIYRYLRSS